MRMTIPALLAVLTLSVTMACGSSSDIKTPANQSYRFEGLTTVVTWEASREATHYIVYYDDFFGDNCRVDSRGAPSFCEQLAGNVVGTSYTHPSPGRENYYWVAACNSSGCSEIDDSNPARLSGPPMPEGLVCDRAGPVQGSPSEPAVSSSWEGAVVRFNWAPSPGPRPTHYNIYYEVQSRGGWYGCMYPLAGNVTETTFTLQDQVKPVPYTPWGVRVTGRTSESLTIEWEPPISQESYDITYTVSACNSAGCSDAFSPRARAGIPHDIQHFALRRSSQEDQSASGEATMEIPVGGKHRDVGLLPSTVYSYALQACNEVGCSPPTQTAGLTEADGPVAIPSAPSIRGQKIDVSGGTDEAKVTWDKVDGATYYQVYQSDSGNETLDAEVSAPQTGYHDGSPNSSWFAFYTTTYRVKACNKAGCSAFSESVTLE